MKNLLLPYKGLLAFNVFWIIINSLNILFCRSNYFAVLGLIMCSAAVGGILTVWEKMLNGGGK